MQLNLQSRKVLLAFLVTSVIYLASFLLHGEGRLKDVLATSRHLVLNHVVRDDQNASEYRSSIIEDVLQRRIQQVKNVCRIHHDEIGNITREAIKDQYNFNNDLRMTFDRANNWAVCLLPKAGSTFLGKLVRTTSQRGSNCTNKIKRYNYTSLNNFWQLKLNITVIAVTRNPWRRFVSAYLEKMDPLNMERLKFWRRCPLVKYRPAAFMHFEDFLKCAVEQMERGYYNRHWEPLLRRCDVCKWPFNYVVTQENMSEELNSILQSVGITNSSQLMKSARSATIRPVEKEQASSAYKSYWKRIRDKWLIERFRQFFQIELEMFDYPSSPLDDWAE